MNEKLCNGRKKNENSSSDEALFFSREKTKNQVGK